MPRARAHTHAPVDEAEFVDGLDREDALGHVEPRDVFGKGVVLDQHGHQVSAGEELHQEVQVVGVLERVVQLDDPRRVGLGEDVALGADVRELRRGSPESVYVTRDAHPMTGRTWSFLNISAFLSDFMA